MSLCKDIPTYYTSCYAVGLTATYSNGPREDISSEVMMTSLSLHLLSPYRRGPVHTWASKYRAAKGKKSTKQSMKARANDPTSKWKKKKSSQSFVFCIRLAFFLDAPYDSLGTLSLPSSVPNHDLHSNLDRNTIRMIVPNRRLFSAVKSRNSRLKRLKENRIRIGPCRDLRTLRTPSETPCLCKKR